MSLSQKAQKLSKISEEVIGTKISLSHSMELISKLEGHVNSNVALAKEKNFMANVIKMEEAGSHIFLKKKNEYGQTIKHEVNTISIEDFSADEFCLFLKLPSLEWGIRGQGAGEISGRKKTMDHVAFFNLKSNMFSIQMGYVRERTSPKPKESERIVRADINLKFVMALLVLPVREEVLSLNDVSQDLIIEAKSILDKNGVSYVRDEKIAEIFQSDITKLHINSLSDKKLYLAVAKELKAKGISTVNDYDLSSIGLAHENHAKFWSHIIKYNKESVGYSFACPHCKEIFDPLPLSCKINECDNCSEKIDFKKIPIQYHYNFK